MLEVLKKGEFVSETEKRSMDDVLKVSIRGFISQSQKSGSSLDHVKAHLLQLHQHECLLTNPSLFNWAEQFATDLYKQSLIEEESAPANVSSSQSQNCLLYTSPSPRDATLSRMPSSA